MAAEVETSGVIVKASKNSCVVSVNIAGCTKSFRVSKTIFYVFSMKCEGDLTNLVEEDTEVQLCYKLRPGSAPTIVVVWLGEKPDLSVDGDDPIPVYDRTGMLNDVFVDTDFGQVYVDRRVTFRDGERGVISQEQITFDAVPVSAVSFFDVVGIHDVHFNGPFYKATCAWIGSKPRLVDRFHLDDETDDVEFEDDVCGTVVVIPNDVIALVDVKINSVVKKVMLFRSSVRRVCDRIQDYVDVGDKISMRLRYAIVVPGRKHWFAVSAMKVSDEVLVDGICDSESVEAAAVKSDNVEDGDVLKPGCVNTDRFNCKADRSLKEAEKLVKVIELLTSLTCGETSSSPSEGKTGKVADALVKDTVEVKSVDSKETVSDQSSGGVGDLFDKESWILYSDPPLEGVLSYRDPIGGYITFDGLKVFLDPSNFYIDGEPCKVDVFPRVAEWCAVNFEGVLMRRKDGKVSEFSHEATCAWIGKKPVLLVMASSLPPFNLQLLEEPKRSFYGQVTKICLPSVALIVLPDQSTVILHINSFITEPQYPIKSRSPNLISNYVRLDDWVQFKVKEYIGANRVSAYDAGPVFSPEVWDKISPGINLLRGPSVPATLHKDGLSSEPSSSKVNTPDACPGPAVCIASPFKPDGFAPDRAYLINCAGIINIKKRHDVPGGKKVITVKHALGSATITDKTVYVSEGIRFSSDSLASQHGKAIKFDAQASMSSNSNSGFVVTRMWDGTLRPASEVVLFSDLQLIEGVNTRFCPAQIMSIPLHDSAIASVKRVPILVPFNALVTLQEVNMACSAIDTFLKVGDFVGVKFERRKFPGEMSGSYFRAVSCWSLSKGGEEIRMEDEIRVAEPRLNSWFSLWGYGEFFCQGHIRSIGGRYFVNYTSKRSGNKMELDIFERGNVSVEGELVEFDKFQHTVDDKITFHLGHRYVKKVSEDKSCNMFEPRGFYAACSWIGKEPALEHCMRDALTVPRGLVCSNRFYEVVVQSFPTPAHAICRLGYLLLLVPLPEVTLDGKFVGVENVNLSKGDIIVVNVLTKDVQNKTVLVSNSPKYKRVKDIAYEDVLKNVSGKITLLPNPTGLIKAFNGDFEVSFELCNVRRTSKNKNMGMVTWLESLSNKLTCGMQVYFSARKTDAKTAPYRAFEVFFSENVGF